MSHRLTLARRLSRTAFPVLALLLLAGCGSSGERAATREAPLRLRTVPVVRATVTVWRTVPGTVGRTRRDTVLSLTGGTVTARPYRVGSRVAPGALLLVVGESRARALLARARARWVAARATARLAARNDARYRALVREGAVTRVEYEAVHRRDLAAQAALQAAADGLAAARRAEAHAVVRAPFAGIVASLPVRLGEDIPPGTEILRLVGGAAEVRARVGRRLYRSLRFGETVRVEEGGRVFSGRVVALDPAVDPRTRTHRFTVLLAGRRAPPDGAYVRVAIPVARRPATVVPRTALVRRAGSLGVFVVGAHGRVAFALVRPGAEVARGRVVIHAGVAPGEAVVLAPPRTLRTGEVVAREGSRP